jgi:hypothetical protein
MTSSTKKRDAPAYQEYASDWLANRKWRLMSLGERGLLDTMRKECWVNRSIPSDILDIAKIFNLNETEVSNCLTSTVLSFFENEGCNLTCPELEAYREKLNERHNKLREGGSNGGKATQKKRIEESITLETRLEAGVKPLSKEEVRKEELKKEEVYQRRSSLPYQFTQEHKEWVEDWEQA